MSGERSSIAHVRACSGAAIGLTFSIALSLSPFAAHTQSSQPFASESGLSAGSKFAEKSGEELFANVCRGCHMSDGSGASGAGAYPSLAENSNLLASGYAIAIVVNGYRAMPPFGTMMNDDQVAAVVNYVRTHFGNRYAEMITAEDVRSFRR